MACGRGMRKQCSRATILWCTPNCCVVLRESSNPACLSTLHIRGSGMKSICRGDSQADSQRSHGAPVCIPNLPAQVAALLMLFTKHNALNTCPQPLLEPSSHCPVRLSHLVTAFLNSTGLGILSANVPTHSCSPSSQEGGLVAPPCHVHKCSTPPAFPPPLPTKALGPGEGGEGARGEGPRRGWGWGDLGLGAQRVSS